MPNLSGPTFPSQPQRPAEIAEHHRVIKAALRRFYLSAEDELPAEFVGRSREDLAKELTLRVSELDHLASLSLLAAVEAAIRQAYSVRPRSTPGLGARALLWLSMMHDRCSANVSRTIRNWLGEYSDRSRLDDILDLYHSAGDQNGKTAVSAYRGALKYRHWLAHGRQWDAKLGRRYVFNDVYDIAEAIFVDVLGTTP